jgi:hypothetical protein
MPPELETSKSSRSMLTMPTQRNNAKQCFKIDAGVKRIKKEVNNFVVTMKKKDTKRRGG